MKRRQAASLASSEAPTDPAELELRKLPRLPKVVSYFDDFSSVTREIANPHEADTWLIRAGGRGAKLDFEKFGRTGSAFLKQWALWQLSRGSPGTLRTYHWGNEQVLRAHGPSVFLACLHLEPMALRELWHSKVLPAHKTQLALTGLKSVFHFAAAMSLGRLRPEHADFIGSFRLPTTDKHVALRDGSAFLTVHEESRIIDYLDGLADRSRAGISITLDQLGGGCILACAYQHGVRSIQIAKLRRSDVRVSSPPGSSSPIVHATFWTAKQRWSAPIRPMMRSIHRDWAILFAEYLKRSDGRPRAAPRTLGGGAVATDALFGCGIQTVGRFLAEATVEALGHPRTATDLRHTAAQRLADAGASQEELAEFLGHTSLDTCLIYFDASPTQASRLNRALALSPIYTAIVDVARTQTIDKAALLHRPRDEQVQGCPHGIPIEGIGACTLGQSLCSKNPVLACYSCRKFHPVAARDVHRRVLESLRPVVRFFFDASKGEAQSPAYGQLCRTLATVEQVAEWVEALRDCDE